MFNSEGKLKMSAKQIKDFFALENIPDKLVIVELPKNTILEVSIVGPQESWGKTLGGGVQFAFPYAKYSGLIRPSTLAAHVFVMVIRFPFFNSIAT